MGHRLSKCERLPGPEGSLQLTASEKSGASVLQPQGDDLPTRCRSMGKHLSPVELLMTLQPWLTPELQAYEALSRGPSEAVLEHDPQKL